MPTYLAPTLSICSFTSAGRRSRRRGRRAGGRWRSLAAGDGGADHEHLGGEHHAGGGGEHREVLVERIGGEQHALVAGDARHRRERVHGLGARRTRDGVGRESGDLALRQSFRGVQIPKWHERREEKRARPHPRDLAPSAGGVGGGRIHLDDEVGRSEQRGRVVLDGRAGLPVGIVGRSAPRPRRPTRPATANPACTSFLQDSGTRATRRSPGRVSLGTAIFIPSPSVTRSGAPVASCPSPVGRRPGAETLDRQV